MEDWQAREELLIGKDNIEKLKNATVFFFEETDKFIKDLKKLTAE